jgi:hypothetical protein
MIAQAIQNSQRRLFQVLLECIEEFDNLFFLDTALV